MPWYLRKTLRLGPLRVNLSKRGVGLSVGGRGARAGVDATGAPYVHAGRGGLYVRKRWGRGAPAGAPDTARVEEAPPPEDTHHRVPWGWLLLVIGGLILGRVLLAIWH